MKWRIPLRIRLSKKQRRAMLKKHDDRCVNLKGIDWENMEVDGTNTITWDEIIDAVGAKCTALTMSKFLGRLQKEAKSRQFTTYCTVGGVVMVHNTVKVNSVFTRK